MHTRTTLLATSMALALASLTACTSAPPQASAAAPIQSSAAQAAAAAYDFDMDIFHPVAAKNGMVASEQERATRIGLEMLRSGGNAVDAAVAVGFALTQMNVVISTWGSILFLGEKKTKKELVAVAIGLVLVIAGGVVISSI